MPPFNLGYVSMSYTVTESSFCPQMTLVLVLFVEYKGCGEVCSFL